MWHSHCGLCDNTTRGTGRRQALWRGQRQQIPSKNLYINCSTIATFSVAISPMMTGTHLVYDDRVKAPKVQHSGRGGQAAAPLGLKHHPQTPQHRQPLCRGSGRAGVAWDEGP